MYKSKSLIKNTVMLHHTRKRKRRVTWKITDGFNRFHARIQELGHQLLETEELWLSNKYTKTSKPPVQCKDCQQECTTASIDNIMNGGRNIGCPCRYRSERRPANHWPCNQQCGNANCTYIASSKSILAKHTSKIRIKCPWCHVSFTQQGGFHRHFRSKHKELVDTNGSCGEYNIPSKRAPPIKLPESFSSLRTKHPAIWHKLTEKGGYNFLVRKVKDCIQNDLKGLKKTMTETEHRYVSMLKQNNVKCHAIAQEILTVLIAKGMLQDNGFDDAGTRLPPDGISLREHGGIYALSYDRIDNDRPHFLEGEPVTRNLRFIILPFNSSSNMVVEHGKNTCQVFRDSIPTQQATEQNTATIITREKSRTYKKDGKQYMHLVYQTCMHAYHGEQKRYKKYNDSKNVVLMTPINQFRDDFPTSEDLFQYCIQLFEQQNAQCAISCIIMDNDHTWRKPSLDAIEPRKGHTKGNLRFVCRVLNSINNDKKKTHDVKDDPLSSFTSRTFFKAIGMDDDTTEFIINNRYLN
jgi:hypothetical protein